MPSITVLDSTGATQTVQSLPAVGSNVKVNSLPITIATDDGIVALLTTPPLPTGAASAALQTSGNASLTAIAAATGAVTTGGLLFNRLLAAATTNATLVKAAAGQVYSLTLINNSATVSFVKLYNSATIPTAGAGTPVATILLPANSAITHTFPNGLAFSAGIGFTLTGLIADADTTATAANTMVVTVGYK